MRTQERVTGHDPEYYYRLCVAKKKWEEAWLKKALDIIQEKHDSGAVKSMLEIGCGVSDIIPHLPSAIRYTGLDPVGFSIAESRKNFPKHRFIEGFADAIPCGDGAFDLVFSCQTIQSFEEPRESLREMARVVRPGGYILIVAPNLECPWGRINAVRHYTLPQRYTFVVKRFSDLALRFFGSSRFRIIPKSFLEITGRYEKGDDGMKYVASAWEVLRFLRQQGFGEVFVRKTTNPLLKMFGPLKYYGGGMFLFMQKKIA